MTLESGRRRMDGVVSPRILHFGLIGCGEQGRLLASALDQVPRVSLVACSDPDPSSREAVPGADLKRYSDFNAMLQQTRGLDAVIVATPHTVLAEAALYAAETGHHVFCEKPLAPTGDLARPVVRAARRNGVNLMVGYIQRFFPLRQRTKALLDGDAFGQLAYVVAGKGGPPLLGWRHSRRNAGGQLLWVGSHLIDQLHWLLGRRVQRVYAEIQRGDGDGTDLTSVVTLRFTDGLLAHLDCSQLSHDIYDYVDAMGAEGHVRSEWMPTQRLLVQSDRIPQYAKTRTLASRPEPLQRAAVAELTEFVDSIRQSRPPSVTGDDALRVLDVLDAVVRSAERGEPVEVPVLSDDA